MIRISALAPILFILLFAGLWIGGLRNPVFWTPAAALLWGAALWRPPNPKSVPFWRGWAAWILWAALSALFSSEPFRSLTAFSYSETALVFFAMACSFWRAEDRRAWFWLLCISGTGLGLAAFVWKTPGFPMSGLLYPYYNYTTCVEAMTFAACLGALSRGYPKERHQKLVLLGLMAFCLAEILFAKSRGALLACVFSTVLWLWRKGWQRTILWGGVAMFAIVTFLPAKIEAPWLKLDKPGAYVRPHLWASAMAVANDHALFGAGPGLFERGFQLHNFPTPEGTLPTRYGMRAEYADSELFQMAAETGWTSLALFLWLIGSIWIKVWKRRNIDWTQEAGLYAFHAVFFQTLFDNVLHLPALHWLFFSCLAVMWGETEKSAVLRRSLMGVRVLCGAGLILAATAWIPDWAVEHYENLAFQPLQAEPIRRMHQALALAPGDPGLWEDLARLYLRRFPPDLESSLQALSEASRLEPTNALYPLMKGKILGVQGKWKEALSVSDQALFFEPGFAEARMLRAESLCHLKDRDEASRELARAEALRTPESSRNPPSGYSQIILYFDVSEYKHISSLIRRGCK